MRTGSRSVKSDDPPKLVVAGLALASAELQKGLVFCDAPTGTFDSVPMPRPGGVQNR